MCYSGVLVIAALFSCTTQLHSESLSNRKNHILLLSQHIKPLFITKLFFQKDDTENNACFFTLQRYRSYYKTSSQTYEIRLALNSARQKFKV